MRLALFVFLSSLFLTSFANTKDTNIQNKHYVLGLDFGVAIAQNLGESTAFPVGYSTFSYDPKNNTDYPLSYGATFSRLINLSSSNALQLGVSYHYIDSMDVKGTLVQGITPPSAEFDYQYSIHSSQVLAEAKFMRQWYRIFYPYLTGGIGAAFNTAENYSTNIPDYLTVTPEYENKTTTSFSYMVGFGVDVFVLPSVTLGVGYRFSDLGKAGLGDGQIRNAEVSDELQQSHLYLSTFLLNLNWFF